MAAFGGRRFHRGISLLMVVLGPVIVAVEAARHHAASELALLGALLVAGALAARWLVRDLPVHPANFPAPSPSQGLRMVVTGADGHPEGSTAAMKRSAALTALSRDHHHALQAALTLRPAGAGDLEAAVAQLQAFWEPRGRRHFEIEEQHVLPARPQTDANWREATARVRDEHARIRPAVDRLSPGGGEAAVEAAPGFGQLLHDHVRFEERRLFGLLETRLPEHDRARLGEAVERTEAGEPSARPASRRT